MRPATVLRKNKLSILQEWERRVRERIHLVRDVPRVYLLESMPLFLDDLAQRLEASDYDSVKMDSHKAKARQHDKERSQIDECEQTNIVIEYQLLNDTIFDVFDQHGPLPPNIRKIINTSNFDAINCAIVELSNQQFKDLNLVANLFNVLSKTVPEILWIASLDGKAEYFNKSWYEFTGLDEKSSLGNKWLKAIHPDDREKWIMSLRDNFATGSTITFEKRLLRKDETPIWFLTRAAPLRDDQGLIIKWIGACTEIQEQKKETEELIEEKRLRSRFTNALTHDLRNPLQVARLNTEIMLKKFQSPEQLKSGLEKTLKQLYRMNDMINDLLDVESIHAGHGPTLKKTRCDLSEVLKKSIDEFSSVFGDRFKLQCEGHIEGHWDPKGLKRVIENLLNNAVKYGTPGTPITIRLHKDRDHAAFSIHNHGPPLREEDKELIFTMFGRSKKVAASGKTGWGIGLSIVKGIIEAHEGKIHVESSSEIGTTFFIELPLNQ